MTEQVPEYRVGGMTAEQCMDEKANRVYQQIIDMIESRHHSLSLAELERVCAYLAANCIATANGDTEAATLSLRRIMMDALNIANMPADTMPASGDH